MNDFDTPKTRAMRHFLKKESHRVNGLSIEPDGVFIYTDSSQWSDDAGSGTFRGDSETAAIKEFYASVQPSIHRKNPVKKNPENDFVLFKYAADFANKLRFASKEETRAALDMIVSYSKDQAHSAAERAIYKKLAAIVRSELKGYAKNPIAKKTRKKAAKKTARRKNPAKGYVVFANDGAKAITFLGYYESPRGKAMSWLKRDKANIFATKAGAKAQAKRAAQLLPARFKSIGIAPNSQTTTDIIQEIAAGK